MPKRLAITIAGAVSLGSYEAGVLYEVLDAIHQHNCVPGTPDEERIEIDVLTGASAGWKARRSPLPTIAVQEAVGNARR